MRRSEKQSFDKTKTQQYFVAVVLSAGGVITLFGFGFVFLKRSSNTLWVLFSATLSHHPAFVTMILRPKCFFLLDNENYSSRQPSFRKKNQLNQIIPTIFTNINLFLPLNCEN